MPDYYHLVPKDPAENLKFRRELIRMGSSSKKAAEELWIMCSRDILFYVNAFCWIFEPRSSQALPFITYDYQDVGIMEIHDCMGEQDLVVEKSRDMGASWMCITVMEHRWHFHKRFTALLLSRKEELVDSKGQDPRSLFAKIDFLHENQPEWLLPNRNRMEKHYSNLDNRSSIDGESTNKFAGVADRRFGLLLDEFSKMENQDSIFTGTMAVCDGRTFNFTPNGSANTSYEIAHNPDFRKLTFHWSQHPVKNRGLYEIINGDVVIRDTDYWIPARQAKYKFRKEVPRNPRFRFRSPWYDKQCDRCNNDRQIAQELDIDYLGSEYQYFDPVKLTTAISMCISPWRRGELHYDVYGSPAKFKAGHGRLDLWCYLDQQGGPPYSNYAIGVDVAAGTGASNSVAVIADISTGEQVGEFVSPNISPEAFAAYVVALGRWFRNREDQEAFMIWEAPGPGRIFGNKVLGLGYGNIFLNRDEKSLRKKVMPIPGWWPTIDSKESLMSDYKEAIDNGKFIVRSALQLEECRKFIFHKDGWIRHAGQTSTMDPSGARAQHGDRPMAGALCYKGVQLFGGAQDKTSAPVVLEESMMHRQLLAQKAVRDRAMW